MEKKWKRTAKRIALCLAATGILLAEAATGYAYEAGTVILPVYGSTPAQDCVLLGIRGDYVVQAQKAVERINEIRLEACKEGVQDPWDVRRSLTEADYVPVTWSAVLEKLARIRAAEASLRIAHDRPNGTFCWEVNSDETFNSSEVLAWNWSDDMLEGIEQWYGEKDDWVNETPGAVTGHYTAMIDPKNTYVGLGCFLSEQGVYPNTTCGRFSNSCGSLGTSPQAGLKDCIQTVEVLRSSIGEATLQEVSGDDSKKINVGEARDYECVVETNCSGNRAQAIVLNPTWTSSAPNVASVDNYGHVTALDSGEATITASDENGFTASVKLNVIVKVSSISIPESQNLTVGKSVVLNAVVNPANATDKSLKWTSGNEKIATVSGDGKVTARKPGKAIIKATAKDGSKTKASCVVIVDPKKMSAPSLSAPGNGKLKVKWKKQSGASGYQIQYGLKKDFKGAKTKKAGSGKTTLALGKLKKKKTYYVRIRAYKKIDGEVHYGPWSARKSVKIK